MKRVQFTAKQMVEIRKAHKKFPTLVGCASLVEENNARADLGKTWKKIGTNL